MTTLAAAFPRLGSRGDRATVGPDLGVEPPIRLGDERFDRNERRAASFRWLAGASLAGLCGVTLIGAALYLDLDSQYDFAEAPEFAAPIRPADLQEGGVNPSKGDRLLRPVDIVSDKQTFKAPTIIKVGDKEVVKARPFTRLETTLTMTPTGFADAVPPFNPLKIVNGGTDVAEAPPDPGPVQDSAEVTFRIQDLSPSDADQTSGQLTQAEAEAQVVETLKAPAEKAAAQSLPPQILLMRTSRASEALRELSAYATVGSVSPSTPFASIEVRMIPENVSNVVKANPDDASPNEKLVQMRHGESFEDVLKANGASPEAILAILAAFGVKHGESPVGEGQKILLLPEETAVRGEKPGIARISVYADDQLKATVAITDEGGYKPVTVRTAQAPRRPKAADDEGAGGGMSLYQSLYETALKQGLPRSIIDVTTRVFANDVDFQRATAPGDSLEAFFSDPDDINPRPELLCASMTVRDQTFKYYRFQTPDDNMVDFYDENGRSMRKFLVRKPIAEGDITSPFGMRFHPILHYARMHTGRRLGGADRHADLRRGQWRHHQGGVGWRVRTAGRNPTRQRLCHRLQSHVLVRPRDRRGRARRSGSDCGLSRRFGTGDRPAPALRGDHQRELCRPDGDQAAPHARVRRQDAWGVQAGARPDRSAHGRVPLRRSDGGGEAHALACRRDGGASTELDRKSAAGACAEPQRCANFARAQVGPAQFGKRPGLTAFRQFRPAPVENEPVVPIARRRKPEQRLQQAVDRGRGKQVAPAHDIGHALQRVVDHHRQMIARRQIAAA